MIIRQALALFLLVCAAPLGCADDPDPIIGKWEGDPIANCNLVDEFEIDDDFDGEGYAVFFDVTGVCTRCAVEISVDPEGDNEYELDIRGGQGCTIGAMLECEIDGDDLECQDAAGRQVNFDRD